MLFDIRKNDWDDTLLDALNIPRAVLPRVTDTSGVIGMLDPSILGRSIPVAALCGDQHSALFGQGCFEPGMMKNTYGTGCFLLMNTGDQPAVSQNGLVSTIAWRLNGTMHLRAGRKRIRCRRGDSVAAGRDEDHRARFRNGDHRALPAR